MSTLNEMVKTAKEEIKSEFGRTLKIRNKSLMKASIRHDNANKRDWPNISSTVGILKSFSFLTDHIKGDTAAYKIRVPKISKFLAIPNEGIVKKSASGRVPVAQRPKALLRRKGHFITTLKGGKRVIARRVSKNNKPIEIVYNFAKSAKIIARTDLLKALSKNLKSQDGISKLFGKSLAYALNSAK